MECETIAEVLRKTAQALDELKWKPQTDREKCSYLAAKGKWERLAKMGKIGVEFLIKALDFIFHVQDNEEQIKIKIVEILGKLGDARGVKPFIKILKEDRRFRRKYEELYVLIETPTGFRQEVIRGKAERSNFPLSVATIKALGQIGDISAKEALEQAGKGRNKSIRIAALKALQEIQKK